MPSEDLNVALHDQEAAMRWVKNNIEMFGGDPSLVSNLLRVSDASLTFSILSGDTLGRGMVYAKSEYLIVSDTNIDIVRWSRLC